VVEFALVAPVLVLLVFGMIEFGRMVMVQQVLTNAAREGARVAILSSSTDAQVTSAVVAYMTSGQLPTDAVASAKVAVERTVPFAASNTASRVTVSYPFNFTVLNPVMRLVKAGATAGEGTTTMVSVAMMRNES
jgi:Flp pilus assembly protein TadG